MKRTIVLDFDGVLHSYASGWCGARVIPDPPVPGALAFLVALLDEFDVCVLSSRSHQLGGRRAMKRWLFESLCAEGMAPKPSDWMIQLISAHGGLEPWDYAVEEAARWVVRSVRWPLFKPAAHVTIDDRALTFRGRWPELETLQAFRPWNKKPQRALNPVIEAEFRKDAAYYKGLF